MKITPALSLGFALLLSGSAFAAKEESVLLYENHRIVIAVPEGYTCVRSFGEDGSVGVKITDAKQAVNLQISFLPDPEERFASARARKEFMAESFQPYVESSVEKAMQFEEIMAALGSGTYCVFTDASLVGKTELPPGEYLNATTGIKAWSGCAAVFTLLSNETTSKEYRAALKIITEGLRDKIATATL